MATFNGWRLTRAGVVFVVGILVLALVVFGVIMFVRDRGEQARRNEAIAVAEQNLKAQSEVSKNETTDTTKSNDDKSWTETTPGTPITTAPGTTELPETGIDGIGPVIMLTFVTLAISYYVTSRRAARQL